MKAIAVYPGKAHSMHLEEITQPHVSDIPEGRGVLVLFIIQEKTAEASFVNMPQQALASAA